MSQQEFTRDDLTALVAERGLENVAAAMLLALRDMCLAERARADAAEQEVGRLKAGRFTAEEIHAICHHLHGTVDAQAFADGCAEEQRKLYGCAPDRDALEKMRVLLRWSGEVVTPTAPPQDPTGAKRLLLNAYGRACYEAGRAGATHDAVD